MTSSSEARHPIFARLYDRLSHLTERELGARRAELVQGLSGRVVEVGAGNGISFARYPTTVDEVVALEPEPYLREQAERSPRAAAVKVSVQDGAAYPLPLEADSIDAAVTSLVLCTVPDQTSALQELRRVLRPGGELRFMEHVRSSGAHKARVQDALDRSGVWPWVAGGCHCARETVEAIERAGFRLGRVNEFALGPAWLNTNPHVLGRARLPADPGR